MGKTEIGDFKKIEKRLATIEKRRAKLNKKEDDIKSKWNY